MRPTLLAARRSGALHVLVGLLCLIPLLLLAHQAHRQGMAPFSDVRWDVDRDRSFMEIAGYVLLGTAAALLLRRGMQGVPVYLGWSVALLVTMLDDALELHERGGEWLVDSVGLPDPPGLRTQDVGELLVWAGIGVLVLSLLLLTHRRSAEVGRQDSWRLAGLVVLLMSFAVGVDMLHVALPPLPDGLEVLVVWVEAAGEVGSMAAIFAFVVHVVRRPAGRRPVVSAPTAPRHLNR